MTSEAFWYDISLLTTILGRYFRTSLTPAKNSNIGVILYNSLSVLSSYQLKTGKPFSGLKA